MSEIIVGILEDFLGRAKKHNESKGQIAFDCPACSADKGMVDGDGKGNLEVNYYKGVFKCWACAQHNSMHGSIPKLIKRYGNQKNLQEFYLFKPEAKPVEYKYTTETLKLPKGFTKLITNKKYDNEYQEAIRYLKSRNIGLDIISKYNLGYCRFGEEKGRIIIPSYDIDDNLNYYTGRAYRKSVWPKYNNPDLDKKEIIFNEGKVNWDATIYLVEGPFDHIVVPNSIPLLGKYISDKLFMTLLTKARGKVVVVLDDDAEKDIEYLNKKININQLYGRVLVTYLPEGYDIAKIHKKYGKRGVFKILRKAKKIPESRNYTRIRYKLTN